MTNNKDKRYIPLTTEAQTDLNELLEMAKSGSSRKLSTEEFLGALLREAKRCELKIKISKHWTAGAVVKELQTETKEYNEEVFSEELCQKMIASLKEKLKETEQARKDQGDYVPPVKTKGRAPKAKATDSLIESPSIETTSAEISAA
ncbi:MAG: hypothetical protein R3C42_09965 [Parvularculaceae bacterium]